MDKEPKEEKEMPEDPVGEPTGEEKIQDKAEEAVEEETNEESKTKPDVNDEEAVEDKSTTSEKPVEEKSKESTEGKPEIISKEPAEKTKEVAKENKAGEKKPAEIKSKEKKEDQKEKKKKAEHGDDFKYIVRIANTDIDGEKKIVHGLTSIKGIGHHMSVLIAQRIDIDLNVKFGDLSDSQIEKIQKTIGEVITTAPGWMLNHRKDYETGEDIHLIGPEIDMKLRDEVNIMKKIRCYRGIRHERGLPCRGQRTRANNRKGLTLGVSKKRESK